MPSPALGVQTFLTLRGQAQPLADQIESMSRPGLDGADLRNIGKKPKPFIAESSVDIASAANVATAIAGYKALCGTVVDMVDAIGNTIENVAVLDMEVIDQRQIKTATGGLNITDGNDGYILRARWTLQETSLS